MNNPLRTWVVVATLMLAALIPGAAIPADNTSVAVADPYVQLVTPDPLDAYQPSPEEAREQITSNTRDRSPEHYQCRDYPEVLQPRDLVPTANVAVRISFDHRTGKFETIKVDPRVIISYETYYEVSYDIDQEPTPSTPGAFATDHYSWTLAPGVEMYGVFVRGVDTNGHVEWTTISQLEPSSKVYDITAYRQDLEGRELDVWIVATDTTNCRQDSNPLPSNMWGGIDLVASTDAF